MAGMYDRQKRAEERQAQQAEAQKRAAKYIGAIRRCLASSDGQLFLFWLMKQCAWDDTSLVTDPTSGEINQLASIYNEARRGVYLNVRDLLTPDILKNVEFPKDEELNQGG